MFELHHLIATYGYGVVLVFVGVEGIGIPLPGETTLITAAIIAGTGRAGTSFLVRYLTELGLDTTLARNGDRAGWDAEANAGLENLMIAGADLPYVVKSPWISEYAEQIALRREIGRLRRQLSAQEPCAQTAARLDVQISEP